MNEHSSTAAIGILYAEDFGQNARQPRVVMKATSNPPSPPPPPVISKTDIDAACIRAVQAAERIWSKNAEDRRAEALSALSASFAEARKELTTHAEAVADGIARTILSALSSALPHLCRSHGDAEVQALLARLAPLLAPYTPLVVRVHQGLIETLASDLAAMDDSLLEHIELRPANLPPGDVRLSWEHGRVVRDSATICAALQDCLSALGLSSTPTPLTQLGSFEHAQ
jgi:hypothetical protein